MSHAPDPAPGAFAAPSGAPTDAFARLVAYTREHVDRRLRDLLAARRDEAAARGPDTAALASSVADLTMRGGKRQRPALALAAFIAAGGEAGGPDEAAVLEAGASLELLQTYLLIHDDWMDGDATRRGGPSVHTMLQAHFGDRQRGDASAILAGDLAGALSLECLARAIAGRADAGRILGFFAAMQQDVIHGQQLDLSGRAEDVEAMHELKTGAYTVRGPLVLGALFAGSREVPGAGARAAGGEGAGVLTALEAFARPLGVAFQLRDDLLGTFGDERETGKPFGSDLRAGKRTAVLDEGLKRLEGAGAEAVRAALGRATASLDEVRAAAAALEACGARAAVEARLGGLLDEALSALRGAPLTPAGTTLLEGAARALTARRA